VTYCLVIDDTLPIARQAPVELYRLVHTFWREALAESGTHCEVAPEHYPFPSPRNGPFFCFQEPGRTDLVVRGEKLLGSAQRRIPGRVLQHGSLLLGRRFAAHPGANLGEPGPQEVETWIDGFLDRLAHGLTLERRDAGWNSDQAADIERRRQHYAADAWTRRR
jgi:hypothetical protein